MFTNETKPCRCSGIVIHYVYDGWCVPPLREGGVRPTWVATHDLRNAPLAVRGSVFGEINPSRGIFTGNQVSVFISLRSPTPVCLVPVLLKH